MCIWAWWRRRAGALLLLCLSAAPAAAQEPLSPIASFLDARALAVDPAGRVYVVDAGRDAVVVLDGRGLPLAVVGGPGAESGQFDDPAAIDPTNGLLLVVADAGNGRLQYFSRDYAFVGAAPVHSDALEAAGEGYGTGRPIAVASVSSDEVYVIEALSRTVRRVGRAAGGAVFAGPAGRPQEALQEPIALAVVPEAGVYVADRGRGAVVRYDAFGAWMHTYPVGAAVQAVRRRGAEAFAVLPEALVLLRPGGAVASAASPAPDPLVDAAAGPEGMYLLTRTGLYYAPGFSWP